MPSIAPDKIEDVTYENLLEAYYKEHVEIVSYLQYLVCSGGLIQQSYIHNIIDVSFPSNSLSNHVVSFPSYSLSNLPYRYCMYRSLWQLSLVWMMRITRLLLEKVTSIVPSSFIGS
jgi:hypothetical protein